MEKKFHRKQFENLDEMDKPEPAIHWTKLENELIFSWNKFVLYIFIHINTFIYYISNLLQKQISWIIGASLVHQVVHSI